MRLSSLITSAAFLALAACGGKKAVEIDTVEAAAQAARWNGSLATPAAMSGVVQVQGTSYVARDGNRTRAVVSVNNASPGGVHPWHVHRGRCGYDNGIVGSANAYPVLKIGDNGTARQTATLDVSFPVDGEYFVNVHASPDNMQTIVACGNLAPPAQL